MSIWAAQMFDPGRLWLNDIDVSVWAMWKAVADHPNALCERLRSMVPSEELWSQVKDSLLDLTPSDRPSTPDELVELAARRVYCHQVSFSGFGPAAFGTSKPPDARWTERIFERLEAVHRILSGIPEVRITCLDFREVLQETNEDDFAFVDPPYVERGSRMYIHPFSREDHADLAEALESARCRWLLTYGDHARIDDLYAWADIDRRDVSYNSVAKRRLDTFERVISPPGQLSDTVESLEVGERVFRIDWNHIDFEHVRGLASSIAERGIEVPIFVDEDGRVVDGRDRLLAARLAGLVESDLPLRQVDISSSAERRALRLLLQATHKGMQWRTKARHLRELRAETGWSWPEIERQTGIPQTTAWRWVKKLEDAEDEDEGNEEDTARPVGVTLQLPPATAEAFEGIAGENGLTRTIEDAVGLLVDWSELPEKILALVPDEERGEILREALAMYLRVQDVDDVA